MKSSKTQHNDRTSEQKKNQFRNIAPILSHLRAFEATARLGSMTLAAREINTTVSSISRHNRLIAELLAVDLFGVANRGIQLTEEGQLFYNTVSASLIAILEVVNYLSENTDGHSVNIYSESIFMFRWIIPKIRAFLAKNDSMAVKFCPFDSAKSHPPHIVFSFEAIADHSEVFLPDEILPVANPSAINFKIDNNIPLICVDQEMKDWDEWFLHIPELQTKKTSKILVSDNNAAFEAACQGLGAAITRRSVAFDAISNGKLARFGDFKKKDPAFVWCTRPEGRSLTQEERAILAFLKAASVQR